MANIWTCLAFSEAGHVEPIGLLLENNQAATNWNILNCRDLAGMTETGKTIFEEYLFLGNQFSGNI